MHPTAPSTAQARAAIAAQLGDRLDDLRRLSLAHRCAELAVFVALWAAGVVLVLNGLALLAGPLALALRVGGTLMIAVALNAFVLLLHEGMHTTLFRNAALNRWVSVALGSTTVISFTAYKVMHTRHHHYLGDPRDPDDYHNYSSNPRVVWAMHYLRLCTGAFLYILLIPSLALRHGSPEERRHVVQEYIVMALLYAALMFAIPGQILLAVWIIPVVLVGFMINIRGFTQHGITDAHDAFLASRSMRVHPIVAFCLLNENYHLEHHLFPEVPSYHLARLHEEMWGHLPRAVVGQSYLAFLARFVRATFKMDETPIGLTTPGEVKR